MKKKWIAIALVVCFVLLTPLPVFASSIYEINVDGYLCQSEARDGLIVINNYRRSKGLNALVWDNAYEEYLTTRAAELSLKYSFTRLNGEIGTELYHGVSLYGDSFESYVMSRINTDESFRQSISKASLKRFCAGIYKTDNNATFFALTVLSGSLTGDTSLYFDDDYYSIPLEAKDGSLHAVSVEWKHNNKKQNSNNLRKGMHYILNVCNQNKELNNFKNCFTTNDITTKNVNTIEVYNGGIIPKRPGVATISIQPLSVSSSIRSQKVIIRPNKILSVKAKAKTKKITISWTKQLGINGYQIYRSTKKGRGYKLVKTISSASTKTFRDTKVKKGKTYYYKICGYVKSGSKKYPGQYSAVVKCKCK